MRVAIILAMLLSAAPILAATVNVEIFGTVEYEQVNFGQFANVHPGDQIVVSFAVDSETYISGSFPTRAYAIDLASFTLDIGSVTVGLQDPFPAGQTPYFVLRDNDPAVDGFFLSLGPDNPFALPLSEPANFDDYFGAAFSVGYTGDSLGSLSILDAVGNYEYDGLTNFNFAIVDGPFDAIGCIFEQMVITSGVATQGATMGGIKALFD
jgi:hypothetical protein